MAARGLPSLARWALLLGAALVLYAGALRAGFVWDDLLTAVPPRPLGEALGQRTGAYYRPVVMLSFALDRALWGASPFGFHLTNVLLHAAAAGLLARLAAAAGLGPGASLAAALAFLAHPVQTEAVTYVSGRTDVLAAVFVLGALLAWRRARRATDAWAAATAGAFVAALLCKEAVALLPLALLLPAAHPAPRPPLPLLPLAAAAAWLVGVVVGGTHPPALATLGERLPAVAVAALEYARLLVWPADLHLERFTPVAGWTAGTAIAAWVGVVVLLALLALAARRTPGGALFLAIALLAYAPGSGVVPVYAAVADRALFTPEHFLYLPLVGLAPLVTGALARVAAPRALVPAFAVVLVLWAAVVADRNRDWRDEATLFRHTLSFDPPSARIWFNQANAELAANRLAQAERLYREAIARAPRDAAAHVNLGITLDRMGRPQEAEQAYRRALAAQPGMREASRGLAAHLAARGEMAEARRLWEQAGR